MFVFVIANVGAQTVGRPVVIPVMMLENFIPWVRKSTLRLSRKAGCRLTSMAGRTLLEYQAELMVQEIEYVLDPQIGVQLPVHHQPHINVNR